MDVQGTLYRHGNGRHRPGALSRKSTLDAASWARRPRDAEAEIASPADRLSKARWQADLRSPLVGVHLEHQPQRGPADPPAAQGPGARTAQPRGVRWAGAALLPRGRLRVRRRRDEAAAADQRAELRALQDL